MAPSPYRKSFVPIWETSSELLGESVFSLHRAVPCSTRRLASDEPRMMLTPRPVRFLVRVIRKTAYYAAFACHLRIRVRFRCVRLVRPLLPVEVHRRITRIVRGNGVFGILALITLHTRPRFQ